MRWAAFLFLVTAGLLGAGAGRLAYIQLAQGESLRAQAERQQQAEQEIPPQRGDILDARGRLLAGSVRRASVFADPALLEDDAERHYAAYSVAPVLGWNPRELEQLLREQSERRFVWIKRRISDEELEAFEEVRRGRRLMAFGVQYEPVRHYPQGELACHVLGFVGAPDKGICHGLAGIELAWDDVLTGTPGRRRRTVDARRRGLRAHVERYVPPRDGASVVLTIDTYIQQVTERHLRAACERFKPQWATAVVLDPQTGEVLAMAGVPGFDPSDPYVEGWSREEAEARWRNRAVSDAYEPGSVFKPFIAAEALEEGLTRLDEVFAIHGPARSFGRRIVHDTHAYDTLSLREIISRSSNIGMALLGGRCGNERLYGYLKQYGFGERTGIGLPGEHAGLVQPLSRWTGYSTQSVPMGQEVAVTAIQLATAFSVFANGGVLYRPRIVRGVLGPEGETLADHSQPEVVRRVLSEQTAERFRLTALVDVVMSKVGTGKAARIPNYRVFGKTGTAQVADPRGKGYLPQQYVGSFIGGAPADRPRVVALVSLYRPSSGKYYGGTVAAPAVGAILADTLAYLRVPPEITESEP